MSLQNISVTTPIGEAVDRTKRILFQPFDFGKWFTIGFCAWLASLGEGGVHGVNYRFPGNHGSWPSATRTFENARDYVLHNLWWVVPVAIGTLLIALALGALLLWLSSRGKFMFLHCVALDKAEVRVPWEQYARQAHSLFLFRLVAALAGLLIIVPVLGAGVLLVASLAGHGAMSAFGILGILSLGGFVAILAFAFFVVLKLTYDFVVPIQFSRGVSWREGWRLFWQLMSANFGNFLLYLLFQIVLHLGIFAILTLVVVLTCCIAGCFLAIPFIGTVLMLPILVFLRSYSLYYLAQYGPEFNVLTAIPAASAPY